MDIESSCRVDWPDYYVNVIFFKVWYFNYFFLLFPTQLVFLLLTLLQLCYQISLLIQRGWLYWTNLWNWLQVSLDIIHSS